MVFDAAVVLAICAVIGSVLAIGGLIARYERRQTATAGVATTALQTAAEAEEDVKELTRKVDKIDENVSDHADRVRREFGETVQAMQKKIQEFEKWSRDEFVHVKSFDDALARQERSAEQRDERMDKRLERIERKLDEAVTFRGQNS